MVAVGQGQSVARLGRLVGEESGNSRRPAPPPSPYSESAGRCRSSRQRDHRRARFDPVSNFVAGILTPFRAGERTPRRKARAAACAPRPISATSPRANPRLNGVGCWIQRSNDLPHTEAVAAPSIRCRRERIRETERAAFPARSRLALISVKARRSWAFLKTGQLILLSCARCRLLSRTAPELSISRTSTDRPSP